MNSRDSVKCALNEIYLSQSQELLNLGAPNWEFTDSYKFEEKMQKLIARQKQSYWQYTNTSAKRLLIAAAVLVAILSSAMTVPAIRGPVIDFAVKTYKEFSVYFVTDSDNASYPKTIENVYKPQYIPNDFELINSISNDAISSSVWKNTKTDETILFSQNTVLVKSNINTGNTEIMTFTVGDTNVLTFENNGKSVYMWDYAGYYFTLETDKSMELSEIKEIISSL